MPGYGIQAEDEGEGRATEISDPSVIADFAGAMDDKNGATDIRSPETYFFRSSRGLGNRRRPMLWTAMSWARPMTMPARASRK